MPIALMPDATTPPWPTQPEVGASRDSSGREVEQSNASISSTQYVSQAMPIGGLAGFRGGNAAERLVAFVMAGRFLVSHTAICLAWWGPAFPARATAPTTFALPDFRGRSGVGAGTVTDQGGLAFGSFGFATKWEEGSFTRPSRRPTCQPTTGHRQHPGLGHSHGGATVSAGGHSHTTDAQGNHSHGGITGTESATHFHGGTTDLAGEHTHPYLMATPGSGSLAAGGSGHDGAHGERHVEPPARPTTSTLSRPAAKTRRTPTSSRRTGCTPTPPRSWPITSTSSTLTAGTRTTVNLGGGGVPMLVLSPTLTITKIVYAGTQAATSLAALDAAAVEAEGTDGELAAIREELAALRALLMPATRRVMSSPSRGPH